MTATTKWEDAPLFILERDGRRATGAKASRKAFDVGELRTWPSRYLCGGDMCTEIATGREIRLHQHVERQDGDYLLVRDRRKRWFAIDTRTWQRRELVGASGQASGIDHGFVAIGKHTYDLALARLVDSGDPFITLALGGRARGYGNDTRRRVLRAAADPVQPMDLGSGPLRWEVR